MICLDKKYVYLHIPKTAGMSILLDLEKKSTPQPQYRSGHPCYSNYTTTFPECTSFFTFTIVRNPWDRLVSCYEYLKKGGRNNCSHDIRAGEILSKYTFKNFVKTEQFFKTFPFVHLLPQMHFIEKVQNITHIGRFENLQSEYRYICNRVGIPHYHLKNHNKTKHRHYTEYYDSETINIVRNLYRKDIDQFNYSYE